MAIGKGSSNNISVSRVEKCFNAYLGDIHDGWWYDVIKSREIEGLQAKFSLNAKAGG